MNEHKPHFFLYLFRFLFTCFFVAIRVILHVAFVATSKLFCSYYLHPNFSCFFIQYIVLVAYRATHYIVPKTPIIHYFLPTNFFRLPHTQNLEPTIAFGKHYFPKANIIYIPPIVLTKVL